MSELPEIATVSPTVAAIYAAYEKKREPRRRYLGASVIGKDCSRRLWYDFRWCGEEVYSGRMLRLFQTGNLEEARIIHNLREIGITVEDRDPAGQQFGFRAIGGHVGGHMDAAALGFPEAHKTWHVCEFKTASHKYFVAMRNGGVEKAKPEYWAQMQLYMHWTGMERAAFIVVEKDTDDIYFERVKYDAGAAMRLLAKAQDIVTRNEPGERVADSPDKFPCKFCHHAQRCHGTAEMVAAVDINCRTCCHATPVVDDSDAGAWRCEKRGRTLGESDQAAGCGDHLLLPGLVHAKPIDGDDNYVEYQTDDGSQFINGVTGYSSKELARLPRSALSLPIINNLKRSLGATVVGGMGATQ